MQTIIGLLTAVIVASSFTDSNAAQRQQAKEDVKRILTMLVGGANKLVGWAFFLIFLSPITVTLVALVTNVLWIKSLVALMPVFGIALYIVGGLDNPALIAAVKALPLGTKVLRQILLVFGLELTHGVILSVVPFANDPALLLAATAGIIAIVFFALSEVKWTKPVMKCIGFAIVVVIFIAFMGGRDAFKGSGEARAETKVEPILLSCIQDEHLVDNRLQHGGYATIPVGTGNCHTKRLVIPGRHAVETSGAIEVRNMYQDGTMSDWYWYTPGVKNKPPKGKLVRGKWFRNDGSRTGGEPVTIVVARY